MANRAVRPGDVIAQCLIAAKGEFVKIATIHDFLIARNMVNATRKIGAYIGDVKKYNFGLIDKRGDSIRLVNWESFDANGHNRSLPPGLTVKQRNLSGIYTITNAMNGAMYVGQAMNFGRRWASHKNALNKGTEHHSRSLQDDWNAFGKDAFLFNILLVCDLASLHLFEHRAISVLKPAYNTAGTCGA
jgi:GIY-YIG catalytic domain